MIVISDTTPLISLMKIHHLGVLRDLYETVYIPSAVYAELTSNSSFSDEAAIIQDSDFIKIMTSTVAEDVSLLRERTGLDLGESEAIILATSVRADLLLMDERRGRSVAKQSGLRITGVVGVLMDAYRKNFLSSDEIKSSVAILRQNNRFISEKVYAQLLQLLE